VDAAALLGLAALTSAVAYAWGRWRAGLRAAGLWQATGGMLDAVGLTLIFFALNLGVGGTVVLAIRLGGGFASFYLLDDPAIPILSLLQGLVFQRWRDGR
jgi:hypothetical protein